jgi:hypothetical protein
MKALLQKNGVLDFLKANKENFHKGIAGYALDNSERDQIETLERFGLVLYRGHEYAFTNHGYVFLNNFEFEELPPTAASPK